MRYWFVNQGTSYEQERKENFLYAPKDNIKHHINVKDIKTGDIIFCNKKGYILSIAKALSDGYESPIPDSIKGLWAESGFKVDVKYIDLKNKFRFNDYKDIYMSTSVPELNPFDVNGNAKMGYLFPLEKEIAHLFTDKINENKVYGFINEDSKSVFDEMQELQEEEEQFEDINNLNFHLDLNGTTVQSGNSGDMIFSIDKIVSYVSQFFTLKTGDILFTGTPKGVGKVAINDRLEGYLEDRKLLNFRIK